MIGSSQEPPPGLKEARGVVRSLSLILAVLAAIYTALHFSARAPSFDKQKIAGFFDVLGRVEAAVIKPEVSPEEIREAVAGLDEYKDSAFVSEFPASVGLLRGLASNSAGVDVLNQNDHLVLNIRELLEDMEKRGRSLARGTAFFWPTGYWRWLEVVFWGEFGVIVGILVWVCTELGQGRYSRSLYLKEKYWYVTEIVIGPVVILAAFLLLTQFVGTLVEGVTYEEVNGSIYLSVSLSFVLGLYIRRTLGIFNFIKDKLPLPGRVKEGGTG